jgi:hypothetical protein
MRPLPPVKPLSHPSFHSLQTGVEVFCPKTINIKQYLYTNNFSVNNKHFVIQFLKIFKSRVCCPKTININNISTQAITH